MHRVRQEMKRKGFRDGNTGTGEGKRGKGNLREEFREGKTGTVLELSLEVR